MKLSSKIQTVILVVIFLLSVNSVFAVQEDVPGSKDHPLLSRMPGYYIQDYSDKEFDAYDFLTNQGKVSVEGHKYYISYCVKEGASAASELQILRNFTNAITKIGGVVLSEDRENAWMKVQISGAETWIHVLTWNGGDCYDLNIIEKEAMKQDVVADAASMAQGISATGKVALYGIYFDFNKADMKPESEPALKEIAKLLQQNSKLKLYVVGHTDNVGDLNSNMKLSLARAEAVVKALVSKYGIEASRLASYGVASLAPVASNKTEEGKAKNRRVELVEQ
jgi:OOP family OmpA-OmpF porin